MAVALKACLRQLQISICSGWKSRWNILRLPQRHWKACFHFQHPVFVKLGFLRWQQPKRDYGVDGHKQRTSGATVSRHPQMGPSSCRKTHSGLPLFLHYSDLYNYFIVYYNVITLEIKCTINVMHWNIPKPSPPPDLWKNCLPRNRSLVPKKLGTADLENKLMVTKGKRWVGRGIN